MRVPSCHKRRTSSCGAYSVIPRPATTQDSAYEALELAVADPDKPMMDPFVRQLLQLLDGKFPLRPEEIAKTLDISQQEARRFVNDAKVSGWVEDVAMPSSESGGVGPLAGHWQLTEAGRVELHDAGAASD